MGEVYRAEDTTLGREVALKVLPESVAADPDRLARFDREAKILAALNHPNIAAIYSFEAAQPIEGPRIHFLVMELARGETLSEVITRGPLDFDEALPVAIQIAEALEAAHESGIVHRDLKPANVMVDDSGRVKVLDFGLAKAMGPDRSFISESTSPQLVADSPTLTAAGITSAGVLLGTAAYMSPEQARGKPADRRCDIWAFGCLLYEMLTGRPLYSGETVSDILAAILRSEPELNTIPDGPPAAVRNLIERCLDKDPRQRLRDIGEARIALTGLEAGGIEATVVPVRPSAGTLSNRRVTLVWPAVVVLVVVAAGMVGRLSAPSESPPLPLRKMELNVPDLEPDWRRPPVISHDGSKIIIPAANRLWVRDFREFQRREIKGSENSSFACWSPDDSHIAFVANSKIWKVPESGGEATLVAILPEDVSGSGGLIWTEDHRLLLTGGINAAFLDVSDQGGEVKEILDLDPEIHEDVHEIALLPDGKGVLFILHEHELERRRRIVESVHVFSGGETREILRLPGQAIQSIAFSPSGHLLYHRSTSPPGIWAVPFSLANVAVTGEPFMVAPNAWLPSVAADSTLAMVNGLEMAQREIVQFDRSGRILSTTELRQAGVESPVLSPDGKKIAVTAREQNNYDIWLWDLERQIKSRFTSDSTFEAIARWSPDGLQMLFHVPDTGAIRLVTIDGDAPPETLERGGSPYWSPDGAGFVFVLSPFEGNDSSDIWHRKLDAPEAVPFLVSPANTTTPKISPDGLLIAYNSDESGRPEIYVRRFPSGDAPTQISTQGGYNPAWNPSGSELFYLQGTDLMAVEIRPLDLPTPGPPRRLFSMPEGWFDFDFYNRFAVALDGQSFYVPRDVEDSGPRGILTVVQNWPADFAR